MRYFLLSVYAATLLIMSMYLKKHMYYDFDVLMYSACALEKSSKSPEELHKKTYDLARASLPPDKWLKLTDSLNDYRHQLHLDPEKFTEQLSFYHIKPLYVWLLKAGFSQGINPFLLSIWVNLICYLLTGFLMMRYLLVKLEFKTAYVAAFCVSLLPMVLDTVRNNTPDMLATFLFISAVVPFLNKPQKLSWISVLFFVLLILVRAESFILLMVLSFILYFKKRENFPLRSLLLLIIPAFGAFLFVMICYNDNGWPLLYRHSFLGYIADLSSAPHGLTFKEYLIGFKNIPRGFFVSDFALMILLLVLLRSSSTDKKSMLKILTNTCLYYVAIRLLLFPDVSIRFYTGVFLIAYLLFFEKFFAKNSDPIT